MGKGNWLKKAAADVVGDDEEDESAGPSGSGVLRAEFTVPATQEGGQPVNWSFEINISGDEEALKKQVKLAHTVVDGVKNPFLVGHMSGGGMQQGMYGQQPGMFGQPMYPPQQQQMYPPQQYPQQVPYQPQQQTPMQIQNPNAQQQVQPIPSAASSSGGASADTPTGPPAQAGNPE